MPPQDEKKVLPFYQDTGYGFNICGSFDINAFKSALVYEPRPDDLFIVTYPKCGTTWVQNIVACIYKEGKPFTSALEFLSNTPFLEMTGAEAAKTMKRPGAIKLHLPFHLTPWSPKAKYIFVARNPKDCCVSFYHHTRNLAGYNFKNGSFDDYFELFMDGKVDFGDYFDCLISWYEHRNDPNVLFMTYEDLKKDTKGNVLKIAEFMGQKYKDMLTEDETILEDVIKHSSFDFMKQTLNRQFAELATLPKDFVLNHPDIPQGIKAILASKNPLFDSNPDSVTFVRKGIVGDFKNHLSPEQNRRLEEKFKERTKDTDIPELWKDIMNISNAPKLFSQFVEGVQIPAMFDADCFRSAVNYKARPNDVFIVTYPKCGTTWAQHVLLLIFRQGEPLTSPIKFYSAAPFLEMTGAEGAESMERPGAIKVHLPYHLTPRHEQAKYIYVTRNPKDCCVSFFYHYRNIPGHSFDGTFDEFFELFLSGDVDYGDYFDHLLGWYAHRTMSAEVKQGETSDRRTPFYQTVDGFRLPGFFSPDAFRSALTYKPRPDDLIIVTYPKCGTTWLQNILAAIFKNGKPIESAFEFFSSTPFLEMAGAETAENMERPGAMKSHLPFHLMPWSPETKYIFVARNPKDCCVSYYHHTESIPGYRFTGGSFDDYFELFVNGLVDYGDYFDMTMSWYEHRNDPNVLFITYEGLKKDTEASILKIAEFMGAKYKKAIQGQVLRDVLHHSSFSYMKEALKGFMSEMRNLPKDLIVNNPDVPKALRDLLAGETEVFSKDPDNAVFVRKGIVGGWKNYLSSEQNARLQRKFKERMGDTELAKLWKDII